MGTVTDIAGVLIAGGKSSRMGTNKALLEFDGRLLVQHSLELLQSIFSQVLVVVNDPDVAELLDVPCYEDIIPDAGPLGGLHAACNYSPTNQFFIFPCDVPFVPLALIHHVLSFTHEDMIVVPFAENRLHPLVGLYEKSYRASIEQMLLSGERSLTTFVYTQQCKVLQIEDESYYQSHVLKNINTHAEYLTALDMLQN